MPVKSLLLARLVYCAQRAAKLFCAQRKRHSGTSPGPRNPMSLFQQLSKRFTDLLRNVL